MNKSLLLPFFFFVLTSSQSLGQSCECGNGSFINICFLNNQAVCSEPGVDDCRYLMDGSFLEGSRNKLLNTDNFGPNGRINCQIQLTGLDAVGSADDLETNNCDMVFVGSSFVFNVLVDVINTEIRTDYLENIREWSMRCEENLVIVAQGEANVWGYETFDRNENPNFAFANDADLSIFSGPFGSINSYEQDGAFQGIFEVVPSTGATILAVDNNGNPTLALDDETNDIVVADIGVFCNGGAGPVTGGPDIINDNDILVSNIFALGCILAQNTYYNFEFVDLCPGEEHTLPGGDVINMGGVYVDSLLTVRSCDSVIETLIREVEEFMNEEVFDGCSGDDYEVTVNNQTYNESRPSGVEFMTTEFGCDSVVTINLLFEPLDTLIIDTTICIGESVEINDTILSANSFKEFFFNRNGSCDSVLIAEINSFPDFNINIDTFETVKVGEPFIFQNQIPDDLFIQWLPEEGLSCYDCPNPEILDFSIEQYQVYMEDSNGCSKTATINLEYFCGPYIPNIISLSAQDPRNNSLEIFSSCPLINFEINIFDRWGNSVYQSVDQTEKWDGIEAQNLSQGVYVYIVNYENSDDKFIESGSITITY